MKQSTYILQSETTGNLFLLNAFNESEANRKITLWTSYHNLNRQEYSVTKILGKNVKSTNLNIKHFSIWD